MTQPHPQPQPPAAAQPAPRRRRWLRRIVRDAVLVIVGGYVVFCIALALGQDRMLFPRTAAGIPSPGAGPRGGEQWEHAVPGVAGAKAVAWFIPAAGASPTHPAPVVIYFHGNAELIDYQDAPVALFHNLGCSVLRPEYRGYGRSTGKPSEVNIRQDVLAFYDQLVARKDVDATRLAYYGHSLGGGVAGDLADAHPPRCIILQSTFTSAAAMAHEFYAPSFLVRHPFHTDRVLERIKVPVLIFHGRNDTLIPVAHARKLHELLPGSEYVEYSGDHNDMLGPGDEPDYRRHVEEFLRRCRVVEAPSAF